MVDQFKETKFQWVTLALMAILSLSANAQLYPAGDLNQDFEVDLEDVAIFAGQWLDDTLCSPPNCAEIDGLTGINLLDFGLLAENWQFKGYPLVINEFMASNNSESGIADPQGDFDDWLEIYNFGDTDIELLGFYLSDDIDNHNVWQFPDITIDAGGYLVVWADRDIDHTPGLHADFRLSADGDEIALFDTYGTLIDSVTFTDQVANISYGRWPDANIDWRFFATPTPGAQNENAYIDFVGDTQFSHNRGFYDFPFNLCITCSTPGADIYYTTDGSAPIENEAPALTSTRYTGPITINSNTCVRAAAIKSGWMPSNMDTHTYIFYANNAIRNMPLVSLVGDEYGTFFEPDGVMAIVGGYYDNGVWKSDGPDSYNNPIHRGIEYERPVSFEIIDTQTQTSIHENCGIRVHGSDYTRPRYTRGEDWSTCWVNYWPGWNSNKFSFNLWFRTDYGDNRLEHPWFPFIDVDRFKSLVLRAGHNDQCTPFVKDEWARRLFLEMGRTQLTGSFSNLYLNGQLKGYYNHTGRGDEEFYQEWYGSENEFDVITQSGVRNGDSSAWNSLISYANSHDLSNTAYYEYVASKLGIPTFIDFLILEIHIGNFDWPGNNWDVHRERSEDGIFRFSVWDAEGLAEAWYFGGNCENCADTAFENFPSWSSTPGLNHFNDPISYLYRALKANAEFRLLFADHVHRHFRNYGVLTEEHLLTRWWEVMDEVSDVLPETENYPVRFVPDTFIPVREPYVLAAFEDNGLFDVDFGFPVFFVNGPYQYGGYVSSTDTISINQSTHSGTLYYTTDGNDPRTPASIQVIAEGFTVPESAPKKVLVPTGDIGTSWRGGSEPYDDLSWTSGSGGVGYEMSSGYESYINIDVGADMYDINTTCYIRIPFIVDGDALPSFSSLELRLRYDDGFIAYINGAEVKRVGFDGTPQWDSWTGTGHESYGLEPFDISEHIGTLQAGENILAIHGLNTSKTSSDFLISAELQVHDEVTVVESSISPGAIEYSGGFNLDKSTHLKSRILGSGGQWSPLNEAVYAFTDVAENLRITEIMYHPLDTNAPEGPNEEYIELKNIGPSPINLNLVSFTNGIDFTFGPVDLPSGPDGYILVVGNLEDFEAKYGTGKPVAGQYSGALNNAGERIQLVDPLGTEIHNFSYKDSWYDLTDGDGFSLTVIDPANPDTVTWGAKDSWRSSAYLGGSPGTDDSGIIPNPGSIVINEVLAHSDTLAYDWIELYNTTGSSINIGGWFLSDSNKDDPNRMKYEIPAGTILNDDDYIVFNENLHFANPSAPGCNIPFRLSENGEAVYLRSAQGGVLTGYCDQEDFGASEPDTALGRYQKSTGTFNFVAMSGNTPDSANAYPQVGPIVITEINYHPDWPINSPYGNDEYEFIELYNSGSSSVTLYDYAESLPWKFTDGIDYTFPDFPNEVVIPAGGRIVVVKNPVAFSWRYPGVSSGIIFGPYDGQLSNDGEKLQLGKPADEYLGTRYYIRVERVNYSDGSHPDDSPGSADPWPEQADGQGRSLKRIDTSLYGNDPANWQEAVPTPGT
jgi:hypothetical protein